MVAQYMLEKRGADRRSVIVRSPQAKDRKAVERHAQMCNTDILQAVLFYGTNGSA